MRTWFTTTFVLALHVLHTVHVNTTVIHWYSSKILVITFLWILAKAHEQLHMLRWPKYFQTSIQDQLLLTNLLQTTKQQVRTDFNSSIPSVYFCMHQFITYSHYTLELCPGQRTVLAQNFCEQCDYQFMLLLHNHTSTTIMVNFE